MRCWMRPPLVTGASQRTRPSTAACEPSHAGFTPAGGAVDDPFLAPLAATYRDGALTVVVEEQGNDLAAAQPAAVEQGQHGGVAGANRCVAAGLEQAAHLADVDVTAGRQRTRGDALDVRDALLGFGVDQSEAPCFLCHSPDRGEDVVDSRRLGIFLDQDGAQSHDVLRAAPAGAPDQALRRPPSLVAAPFTRPCTLGSLDQRVDAVDGGGTYAATDVTSRRRPIAPKAASIWSSREW